MDQGRPVSETEDARWEEMAVLDPAALDEGVLAEQVRILCGGPFILAANMTNAAIVAYVLRAFYPGWIVVTWLGLFFVVIAARLLDVWRCRGAELSGEAAKSFAARYAFGSTMTGCLWGATASLMWLTPNPAYHAFVVFVAGGMAAGAVTTNSCYLPAMFGFIAPAVLPPILALFIRADSTSVAMGLMLSAFAVVLVALGYRANGWVVSVSRRRLVQEALAIALHQRNMVLHAISTAATKLTNASPSVAAIPELLEAVGEAVAVDRIPVFEIGSAAGRLSLLHVWRSADAPAALDSKSLAARVARSGIEADPFFTSLDERRPSTALTRTMEAGPARAFFESQGVRSVLIVPIVVDENIWGLIGFEDCTAERAWTAVEIDTLRILGDVIGGSIVRQRYVDQLRDANEVVERSPTILFRLRKDPPLRLAYVSRNIALFGYDPSELIDSASGLENCIHPDDRKKVYASIAQASGGRAGMLEFRFRQSDGGYRWLDARYAPIRDDSGRLRLVEGVALDVTERKEAAEKIALLARTDALTALANRRAFIDALQRAFAAAKRGGSLFSLLYIDVDHFKDINDTLGHSCGDSVLEALAERLKEHCRESDVVARLGGDEFAVLQTQVRDSSDAMAMASKIRAVLAAPYALPGGDVRATVSIGVAIYASETPRADMMLVQADLALYRAKEEGRDQYRFYSQTLDRVASDRAMLVEDFKQALEAGGLELCYLPQVRLATGQIVGLQAHVHWRHPKRGRLEPDDFVPIIEKTGAAAALAKWVVEHACRQLGAWRESGIAPRTLSIGMSLGELRSEDEFFEAMTRALEKWRLAPSDLEIDVSEWTLVQLSVARNDVLSRLHALGVAVGIDEFGAQCSSLAYLKRHRVNRIILPKSLAASNDDPMSSALARAIMVLARELGVEIVARGIDTNMQDDPLAAAPPPIDVQNCYYGAPLSEEDATRLLRQGRIERRQGAAFLE